MKRRDVLKKIRAEANRQGVSYDEAELTRHTGIRVGGLRTTVPRHTEIPDRVAQTIFKQLEPALGEGWWRR